MQGAVSEGARLASSHISGVENSLSSYVLDVPSHVELSLVAFKDRSVLSINAPAIKLKSVEESCPEPSSLIACDAADCG